MSWFDGIAETVGNIFDSETVQNILPGIVTAGAGILNNSIQSDKDQAALDREDARYEQQRQDAKEAQALELRLAALKALYGGGSGGGGGVDRRLTDAQRIAAVQNQGTLEQNAIASALSSLQSAYGLGAR